jgi:hypothetical protein
MIRLRELLSRFRPQDEAAEPPVHFHAGPQGLPAVCHDPGCEMPRLEV